MSSAQGSAAGAPLIDSLADISDRYDALLCDVWGCYHNGLTPYPEAVAALRAFRAKGGVVLLLTNAPRPNAAVRRHLDGMGAPGDSYDAIVSSGDATRAEVASGRWGRRLAVVGPERDADIWSGLDIAHTAPDEADAILCTGLVRATKPRRLTITPPWSRPASRAGSPSSAPIPTSSSTAATPGSTAPAPSPSATPLLAAK